MQRRRLLRHGRGRLLSSLSADETAADLRKRLRESDRAFNDEFPDDDRLEDQPVKRLRLVASSLGVTQGDQCHSTLVHNLTEFAKYRGSLYTGRMDKQGRPVLPGEVCKGGLHDIHAPNVTHPDVDCDSGANSECIA